MSPITNIVCKQTEICFKPRYRVRPSILMLEVETVTKSYMSDRDKQVQVCTGVALLLERVLLSFNLFCSINFELDR